MGKTISFVATDELAEWIEEESRRRMTTISSTAQQLLAEKYRAERDGSSSGGESSEGTADSAGQGKGESDGLPAVFRRHADKWYTPESDEGYKFAVRVPDRDSNKYYKTQEGAAKRLRREYE